MAKRPVNYVSRDFESIKHDLIHSGGSRSRPRRTNIAPRAAEDSPMSVQDRPRRPRSSQNTPVEKGVDEHAKLKSRSPLGRD